MKNSPKYMLLQKKYPPITKMNIKVGMINVMMSLDTIKHTEDMRLMGEFILMKFCSLKFSLLDNIKRRTSSLRIHCRKFVIILF